MPTIQLQELNITKGWLENLSLGSNTTQTEKERESFHVQIPLYKNEKLILQRDG